VVKLDEPTVATTGRNETTRAVRDDTVRDDTVRDDTVRDDTDP